MRQKESKRVKNRQWETNRDRVKTPKPGKFWCWGCDATFLSEGEKCWVCGTKNYSTRKGRFKK